MDGRVKPGHDESVVAHSCDVSSHKSNFKQPQLRDLAA
jgi:hypothetical protein